MFVRETALFRAPLSNYLQEKLQAAEAAILRAADLDSLTAEQVTERVEASALTVPTVLREEAEFDTTEQGDNVLVTLKVPVMGNVELLERTPTGKDRLNVRVRMTDDLHKGGDMQGDAFMSDAFGGPEDTTARRGALVFKRKFAGSTSADEIKTWARDLLDRIEAYLPAMADELVQHKEAALAALTAKAAARRQALTTARSLKDELGRGV